MEKGGSTLCTNFDHKLIPHGQIKLVTRAKHVNNEEEGRIKGEERHIQTW